MYGVVEGNSSELSLEGGGGGGIDLVQCAVVVPSATCSLKMKWLSPFIIGDQLTYCSRFQVSTLSIALKVR